MDIAKGTYTFGVCASDGRYTSCQSVTVVASDRSQSITPSFNQDQVGAIVDMSASSGKQIIQVMASTLDKAKIEYELKNEADRKIFEINKDSGLITLKNR